MQGQRVGGLSQAAVGEGEVAQRDGRVWVVGSQGGLGDGQRPLLQRQRVGVPPQGAVGGAEVAQPDGRVGVVGSQGGLGDGQRPLLQGQRVGGAPQVPVAAARLPSRVAVLGWSGPWAASVMASARCCSGSASACRPRSR